MVNQASSPLGRCVLLALLISQGVWAQVSPRVEQDPAQRLLQEQRDQERQREATQPPTQVAVPSSPASTQDSVGANIEAIPEPGEVFEISRIELVGNSLLSTKEAAQITSPFLGRPLGTNRINALLLRLIKAFDVHGWSTSRAYLGKQNLRSGVLVVTVVPGTVQSIQMNGKTLAPAAAPDASTKPLAGGLITDVGVRMAMPVSAGDVLTMSDLEQGVEQINRLQRNKAELQILPGTTPGSTIVGLTNKAGDRLWYSAGMDNYGSQQTGLNRTRLGVEADNVLGFMEVFSLNFIGSHDTNALVASVSVPFGYNTFSYTASMSEYQNLIGETALLYGDTQASAFSWNRVLERSQTSKTAVDAALSLRRTERDINDLALAPQNLSVLRIGINTLRRLTIQHRPAYWTFDMGMSAGLDAFGANQDDNTLLSSDAHSQFTKFDFTITASLPFYTVGDAAINYVTQFSGQWSNRGLFGSEQIYVGGMSTVRGFREAGLSGDQGSYLRNELVWGNVPKFGNLRLEPYVFFDFGLTRLISEQLTRRISGTGIGARVQAQYGKQNLSGEVTLGRPVQQPDFLGPRTTLLLATLNWAY